MLKWFFSRIVIDKILQYLTEIYNYIRYTIYYYVSCPHESIKYVTFYRAYITIENFPSSYIFYIDILS